MARHPEGSEPISQVETQREGIMYEDRPSALGDIAVCISYVEHVAGVTTMVVTNCQVQKHGNLPQDNPRMPAYSNSNEQCTGVNYLV